MPARRVHRTPPQQTGEALRHTRAASALARRALNDPENACAVFSDPTLGATNTRSTDWHASCAVVRRMRRRRTDAGAPWRHTAWERENPSEGRVRGNTGRSACYANARTSSAHPTHAHACPTNRRAALIAPTGTTRSLHVQLSMLRQQGPSGSLGRHTANAARTDGEADELAGVVGTGAHCRPWHRR